MSGGAYYNEHDHAKAAWLRHLMEEGAIARGVVDERSIAEVQPEDLAGFDQHHFFAGIGVWSHALRLAGVADDQPWWTGSCPCGPFSVAGKRLGFEDPRHLWPQWFRLIRERRPHRILGEQSDAADAWIDLVSTDLEALGYAVGSPDIPAAGFGGAHIRQRFYWVADADNAEWWSERAPWHDGFWPKTGRVKGYRDARERSTSERMGDGDDERVDWSATLGSQGGRRQSQSAGAAIRLEDAAVVGCEGRPHAAKQFYPGVCGFLLTGPGAPPGADWLLCRDGQYRPVEPGTSPLVASAPSRLVKLRGYGDALDAEAAANFIAAYLSTAPLTFGSADAARENTAPPSGRTTK